MRNQVQFHQLCWFCLSFLLSFGPAVTTLHHIPRESPEFASQDVVSFVWCLWKTGAQAPGCGYIMVLLALSVLRSPLSALFRVGRPLPSCVQVTGRHPARLCGLWGPGGQGPWLVNEWLEMSHLRGPCAKSTPLLLRPYHPACRGVRLGPVELLMGPRCVAAFYVLARQTSSHLFSPLPCLSRPLAEVRWPVALITTARRLLPLPLVGLSFFVSFSFTTPLPVITSAFLSACGQWLHLTVLV